MLFSQFMAFDLYIHCSLFVIWFYNDSAIMVSLIQAKSYSAKLIVRCNFLLLSSSQMQAQ